MVDHLRGGLLLDDDRCGLGWVDLVDDLRGLLLVGGLRGVGLLGDVLLAWGFVGYGLGSGLALDEGCLAAG